KLGIPATNHMSALDEVDIERIYQYYTPPEEKKIIEQRIQPTIIRRRVKRLVPEAETVEEPVRQPVELKEPAEQPVVTVQEKKEPAGTVPAERVQMEVPAEPMAPELKPERISEEELPAEPKPELALDEAEARVTPTEQPPQKDLHQHESLTKESEREEAAPKDEGFVEEVAPPSSHAPALEEKRKPFKKKKVRPREEPARIISRPEHPVIVPADASGRRPQPAAYIKKPQPLSLDRKPQPLDQEKKPLPDADREKKQIIRPKKKWVIITEDRGEEDKAGWRADRKGPQPLRDVSKTFPKRERKIVLERRPEEVAPRKPEVTVPKAIKRKIKIAEFITVGDLAKKMGVKAAEVIKKLWQMGVMATINQSVDIDTAQVVADDFGYEVEKMTFEAEEVLAREDDDAAMLKPRPPVITVMGHVDHGKTKLLDAIRQTDVVASEAGGITQHIGAYDVRLKEGELVFIDTPGHEAFTAMRARGSHVTDIVILVVAATEGVKEQTVEAINHAKAAGVPIIVAINKIDLPEAQPERVKRELMEHELVSEELGGDTIYVEISAKQKINIDKLLEMILLQSEVLELKANPDKLARGTIVETRLDKGQGPVATVLIQEGTLRVGEPFVSGQVFGKVRAMLDDHGEKLKEAGPSHPVEVVGFAGLPEAGDQFIVVSDERKARLAVEHRLEKVKQKEAGTIGKITLETLFDKIKEGEFKELKAVIKADVHGSIEALKKAISDINTKGEIKVNIIHTAVGSITESDIMLASASNAIVIGFNVVPDQKAHALAQTEHVDVRTYTIIYEAIDDIKKAMEGLLSPIQKERVLGRAQVIQLFIVSKVGAIAGSRVLEGKITRGAQARVIRKNEVIHEGKVTSLKRFKEDVREALLGYECGIKLEHFDDLQLEDIIEAYEYEEIAQKLD
ncbi:MAG TPA: translation initiation factor IF-2, partial [Thermodesulfobacteriota bacterium]|nr:translation initiation factor IF-2 [Thermodesulfobacteriota bacterium]